MKNYKKWTSEQREESLQLTKTAEKLGLIKERCKCELCGQTEGTIDLHNENYDVTLEYLPKMIYGTATQEEIDKVNSVLHTLCVRCHLMYHRWHNNKHDAEAREYFYNVKQGKVYEPIYRNGKPKKKKEEPLYKARALF